MRRLCAAVLAGALFAPTVVQWIATAAAGDISTLAGGPGPALAIGTTVGQQPRGIAVRGTDIYVADDANYVVRKLDTTTGLESLVAGQGAPGFAGDGGQARAALLFATDVAVDSLGHLYVADTNNHRIRRIATDGTITTVAGSGVAGDVGDGGPATLARLNLPTGVALDAGDNLYIADTENHRVRKVDSNGIITPFAGAPGSGSARGAYAGDGGPAAAALLNTPRGLSIDAQANLLIADTGNSRIRRVDPSGFISTVAGTGGVGFGGDGGLATNAVLRYPADVAALASGGFLIADTENHRVRRVDTNRQITTVAGRTAADGKVVKGYAGDGGPALGAELNTPRTVAADDAGNVVVGDTGNARLRKIDVTAATIATIAGTGGATFGGDGGPAADSQLRSPGGVAVAPDGATFVADTDNNRIRRIGTDGTITTLAGTGAACPPPSFNAPSTLCGDDGPAVAALINGPTGIAVGSTGVYTSANNRVRRIDAEGVITTVAGTGGYGFTGDGESAVAATLSFPSGLAIDAAGNLFIADSGNNRIRRVDVVTGVIITVAGNGTAPVVSNGAMGGGGIGDGGTATAGALKNPSSVAFDRFGNLFIADSAQQRVRLVVPGPDDLVNGGDGENITTVAGTGAGITGVSATGDGGPASGANLRAPTGLAFRSDALVIVDSNDHRVREVAPGSDGKVTGLDGETITTIAGDGNFGYSGDGGPATAARLSAPSDAAVAPGGRVLIADSGNNRIRSVQGPDAPPPVPPTIVASGGNAQRTPIGTAFSNPLKATVRDSAGRPTTGAEVTFTAPAAGPSGTFEGGAATASVTTGADGVATSPTFTANSRAGAYEVKATTPAVTGEAVFALINDHGPATSIAPSAGTPQQAQVGTEFTTRLAARVVDAGANPVPGAAVTFTAPGSEPTATFDTPSGGTARTITVTSGEDGTATATALVAGSKPGSYVVSAATDGVTAAAGYELTNLPERTPFVTAVDGTPQSTRTGSDFATALQAGVRDEDNQPLAGVEVTFTAPASGPSGTFAGGAATVTATTDASGVATAPTLTANDTSGSWTVSAAVVGAPGSATFSLTNNAPYPVAVRAVGGTPQSARTATDFATPLRAFVRDETDNPMGGVTVTFTAPSDEPRATFPGGASTASANTDANGVATAPTLTAGRTEGVYTVAGRVEGVAGEALFRLANTAPPGGSPDGGDDDFDDAERDDSPPCPAVSVGPGQVAYRSGFSLVGLPEGTRLPYSPSRLWAWWDEGAGGQYGARDADEPLTGGWGYWKYFRCPTVVDVPPTPGPVEASLPLGAYHGSIIGNPADRPVTVTGHDYAARYHNGDRYRMSAYREPVVLAPGEAMWVFAYKATTIEIEG